MQAPPRWGAARAPRTRPHAARATTDDRVLVAASGFTSLWALTWLGTETLAVSSTVQGGFAVGGVMAGSGLAALWWKTRAMRRLHQDEDEDESEKS